MARVGDAKSNSQFDVPTKIWLSVFDDKWDNAAATQ